LRLVDTVLALMLAVCLAVFPIAMPRAMAVAGHGHAVAAHHPQAAEAGDEHACASAEIDVADRHQHPSHDPDGRDGPPCCGTMACHALQASSVPALGAPPTTIRVVHVTRDQQIAGVLSGRLDRPPRTV